MLLNPKWSNTSMFVENVRRMLVKLVKMWYVKVDVQSGTNYIVPNISQEKYLEVKKSERD